MTQEPRPVHLQPITERLSSEGPYQLFRLDSWEAAFEGLVAGVTSAVDGADFSAARRGERSSLEPFVALAGQLRFSRVVRARQVHGVEVGLADVAPESASGLPREADGLITGRPDLLLSVTVADCVPVYLLEPRGRAIGLLHAGWRGASAGILERGLGAMRRAFGTHPSDVYLHFGPSICGACYEVGQEVLKAFGRRGTRAATLDLRSELAGQADALGVGPSRMSVSSWCTRCHLDRFHSHRGSGKAAGRMAAFLGWRGASRSEPGAVEAA